MLLWQVSKGANSSKYFIMKSINHENISKSVAEGIWATQPHNEAKLNEAFRSVAHVYLIFSVNMSGCFQACSGTNQLLSSFLSVSSR